MEPTFSFQEEIKVLKHSGPGIASFVISIVAIVFCIGIFALAAFVEVAEFSLPQEDAMYIIIGLLAIIYGILNIIGTGLGIYGMVQKNRQRIFSIIGLTINGLLVLLLIYLII